MMAHPNDALLRDGDAPGGPASGDELVDFTPNAGAFGNTARLA